MKLFLKSAMRRKRLCTGRGRQRVRGGLRCGSKPLALSARRLSCRRHRLSASLLAVANDVLDGDSLREIVRDEACNLPQEEKYDGALSDGVFHYFPDEAYAQEVMEGMLEKTRGNIAILDVHDATKEEEFFAFRRQLDPDYDEHYRGLNKLFYDRSFLSEKFAKKHGLTVSFHPLALDGYWNAPFVYSVFFSREAERKTEQAEGGRHAGDGVFGHLGADFFVGVPDSQLRALLRRLDGAIRQSCAARHRGERGDGGGIAAGHYLATGRSPLVYLQNSGEGNIVNALASLLHEKAYAIPLIFVIGWRGEPWA